MPKPTRAEIEARRITRLALVDRDGEGCFFCHDTEAFLTIEHLLSRKFVVCNDLANLCLACEDCNNFLNHMPIVEKMKFYVTLSLRRVALSYPQVSTFKPCKDLEKIE